MRTKLIFGRMMLAMLFLGIATARLQAADVSSGLENTGLKNAKMIVFLGDSITYGGGYIDDFEAVLRLTFPKAEFKILNLGLPSETVSGLSEPGHAGGAFPRPCLHERLTRVLQKTKPDLIFACYGMNDGIYYPPSPERLAKFQVGMKQLHEQVVKAGGRIIHITPPSFDPVPIKAKTLPAGLSEYRQPYVGYNEVLDEFSRWLVAQRAQGWTVVDAHTPMNQHLEERRKDNPDYRLAGDGVHINDTGHWLVAQQLITDLKIPVDASAQPARFAHGQPAELLKLVHQKNRILCDAYLTDIGHQRPGMSKGLSIPEARTKAAEMEQKIANLLQAH